MIKKASLIISAFVVTVIISTSCGTKVSNEALEINDSSTSNEPSAAIEESSTNEVAIGNQVWMTENLNVDKFRNGDPIPEAKTIEEWNAVGPAYMYFDFDPINGEKYGKLYNWSAVIDPRGLSPEGWHIPSDDEWTILVENLGGVDAADTKMKSTSGWKDNRNGLNESGFSALPGGALEEAWAGELVMRTWFPIGEHASWWSSTERIVGELGGGISIFYNRPKIEESMLVGTVFQSVRCIKD